MGAYLVRRILLIFPTLFGIMLINFAVIQIVPGGPVEQMIAQMTGTAVESTARFSGGGEGELSSNFDASSFDNGDSKYRGAQGLDPDIIKEIEIMYGMDKPAHERFFKMLKSYVSFDFGESFFRDQKVTSLVLDKMPVSISLGLWTTLLVYLISIPLGIRKAIKDGSRFDIISSSIVTIGYAIPNFLFAVILIVFFAGGRFYDIFPLRGLVSENFEATATATGTSEVNTFLTKSIISSKANSKFLVMVNSATGGDDATPIVILRRTIGSSSHDIVNDDSQGGITMRSDARLSNVRHLINFHLSYVDSPSSAASTTINYKIVLKGHNVGQDTFLGKSGYNAGDIKVLSSITIMELAA